MRAFAAGHLLLLLQLLLAASHAASFMAPGMPPQRCRGAQQSSRSRSSSSSMMAGFGKPAGPKKKSFEGKKSFEKHMQQYEELRINGYPPPNVVDVYVHAKGAEKFWFVGKCCVRDGVVDEDGPAMAAVKQKRLVFEHAKLLQPREMGGLKGSKPKELELWCAAANSEVSVAQRQQGLRALDTLKPDGALSMEDVGFLPEQYTAEDGKGFYVRLPPNGQPEGESKVKIVSPEEAAAGGLDLGTLGQVPQQGDA